MKYSKQQIFQITAAVLFLIGAVFMLVNTFTDQIWSFWVGLGFALAASSFYIFMAVENRRLFSKKMKDPSYSDNSANINSHEKNEISKNKTTEN